MGQGLGGIIPIYQDEIFQSLIVEKNIAPLNGYLKEYTLNGNEVGFFVKDRFGKIYSKVIIKGGKTKISKFQDPYLIDIDFSYFDVIIQHNGSRNLNITQDLDLEGYIANTVFLLDSVIFKN